jgi:hypothetical protein
MADIDVMNRYIANTLKRPFCPFFNDSHQYCLLADDLEKGLTKTICNLEHCKAIEIKLWERLGVAKDHGVE